MDKAEVHYLEFNNNNNNNNIGITWKQRSDYYKKAKSSNKIHTWSAMIHSYMLNIVVNPILILSRNEKVK